MLLCRQSSHIRGAFFLFLLQSLPNFIGVNRLDRLENGPNFGKKCLPEMSFYTRSGCHHNTVTHHLNRQVARLRHSAFFVITYGVMCRLSLFRSLLASESILVVYRHRPTPPAQTRTTSQPTQISPY